MSDLDRWLKSAKTTWQRWQMQLNRLTPGPKVTQEQLQTDDALTRWRALRALALRPQPELLPALLALSDDPDEMVRAEVADVLVAWGKDVVLEPVQKALAAAPAPHSATVLLETLARLPDPANRAYLQPWLTHEDGQVRAAAAMALAALCKDDDLPQLQQALAEDDIQVQRAIMRALCAPAAGPVAEQAARATDPILRQRAAQAQSRIQKNLEAQLAAAARTARKDTPPPAEDSAESLSDTPQEETDDVQGET